MSISPGGLTPNLEAAQAALREGRFPEAIGIAQQLTAQDSSNFDAWQTMGVAYVQSGQIQEAIQAFTSCVRQRPNVPQPHFNLAQAYMSSGNKSKAREELELCLTLDPAYQKAAQALRQLGEAPQDPQLGVPGLQSSPGGMEPSFPGMQAGAGPAVGQAPPSFSQPPPPFNQGQAIGQAPTIVSQGGFTPGASGLAGGQAPPGSYTAQQGYGAPQGYGAAPAYGPGAAAQSDIDGATRGWAISAIVLGAIVTIGNLINLVSPAGHVMGLIGILLSIGYILGGAGVLGRHNWGRITTLICSGIGAVMAVFALIGAFLIKSLLSTVMGPMMSGHFGGTPGFGQFPTNNPALTQPGMPNPAGLVGNIGTIIAVVVGVIAVIELGYNIPLFRHMMSDTAKNGMVD